MAAQVDGGLAALDCLAIAVLLVDATLGVVFANRAAQTLLASDAPLSLSDGKLSFGSDARALAQLLRDALDAPQPLPLRSVALPRPGKPALTTCVLPLPLPERAGDAPAGQPGALLLARCPDMALAAPAALQQLYGLTPAEADVASQLAQGCAVDGIACRQGTSVNTVKTHLHHLYRKTATRRQGELIALIHASTAPLAVCRTEAAE